MRPSGLLLACTLLLTLACSGLLDAADPAQATPAPRAEGAGGTPPDRAPGGAARAERPQAGPFIRYSRYRIVDAQGFSTPVEAMSFLLPHGWIQNAGVHWQAVPCLGEQIQLQGTWRSPDGAIELTMRPARTWEYNDDPFLQQAVAMSGMGVGFANCAFRPVIDATTFLTQDLIPSLYGPPPSPPQIQTFPDEERQLAEIVRPSMGGIGQVQASIAIAHVDLGPDRAIVLAALLAHAIPMMGTTGGQTTVYSQSTLTQLAIRGPADRRDEIESILTNFVASQRLNPEWNQAVQNYKNEVNRNTREAIAARSRIRFESSMREADTRMRSWEARMDSQAQGAEQFSQAIRGVESWQTPDGDRVELSHGYHNAWQGADGSFLLSDNPNFDPRRALDGTWAPLTRGGR